MLAELIHKIAGFEKEERGAYYPRPSLAGPERCIRQMTYWARGIKPDTEMSDRFIAVLDDSSWHEYLTIDWLNKSAYRVHSQQMEVEVGSGKGHIDGVITDPLGKDRLFEHKALNHFSFERYWKGAWPLDYITQSCLYVKGLRKLNPDINEAVLLIKNKNTSAYLDIVIRYDDETDTAYILEVGHSGQDKRLPEKGEESLLEIPNITGDAVKKFAEVEKHHEAGTLPDRPFEPGTDFPCGYCDWEKTCWGSYESEFKALTTDAELTGDVETLLAFYLEEDMHYKASKKETEEKEKFVKGLKSQVAEAFKSIGARQGRIGKYTVEVRLQKRLNPNREMLLEHISPKLLEKCSKASMWEQLTIKKVKEE